MFVDPFSMCKVSWLKCNIRFHHVQVRNKAESLALYRSVDFIMLLLYSMIICSSGGYTVLTKGNISLQVRIT